MAAQIEYEVEALPEDNFQPTMFISIKSEVYDAPIKLELPMTTMQDTNALLGSDINFYQDLVHDICDRVDFIDKVRTTKDKKELEELLQHGE